MLSTKNFAIIGTGVVGTSIAVLLEQAGLKCIGVNTRSQASYQRFCRYLSKEHLSLEQISKRANLIFITTQDSSIEKVAEKLSAYKQRKKDQIWIHCSGSLRSEVMCKDPSLQVGYLSIHPLQAFATVDSALTLLAGTHYGLEGSTGKVEEIGVALVELLGGIPHRIEPSKKTLYHAAAVVASNYLVSLCFLAVKLFNLAGINEEDALKSLLPLMEGSYKNIGQVGITEALTGPIARGDVQVVAKHLLEMPPEFVDIYKGLGRLALEIGQNKGNKHGHGYDQKTFQNLKLLLESSAEIGTHRSEENEYN